MSLYCIALYLGNDYKEQNTSLYIRGGDDAVVGEHINIVVTLIEIVLSYLCVCQFSEIRPWEYDENTII